VSVEDETKEKKNKNKNKRFTVSGRSGGRERVRRIHGCGRSRGREEEIEKGFTWSVRL